MAELISTTEAKAWMRVDLSDDDTLIDELVRAATQYVEAYTGRQLQTAELTAYADWLGPYMLPVSPVQSVSSITYVDGDGATQTLAASVYDVDITKAPGLVRLAYNESWPTTRDTPNAITYTYKAGYASVITVANATDVFTVSARTFTNGDDVQVWNTGGGVPAGMSAYTTYYVIGVSDNTFQLSETSGGSAINVTDDGTGTNFIGLLPRELKTAIMMLAAHWYEHREAYSEDRSLSEVPMAVDRILTHHRIPRIA